MWWLFGRMHCSIGKFCRKCSQVIINAWVIQQAPESFESWPGKTEGAVWETKAQTQEINRNFINEGLKLDPATIPLVDIHRLPQQPILRHVRKVTRLIIIKLNNAPDKHKIMSNLGKLKTYNSVRKSCPQSKSEASTIPRRNTESVYITEHWNTFQKSF